MSDRNETAGSYDSVADEYARRIAGELDGKPRDRALLDRLAGSVRSGGIVADLGDGTRHVGGYLGVRGVRVCGADLSHGMLHQAARLNPGMALLQADMAALPVREGSWAGIAAFCSLIHIERDPCDPEVEHQSRRCYIFARKPGIGGSRSR